MFKNIIFDIGGVLLTNGKRLFAEKLSHEHNLSFDEVLKEINDTDGAGAKYRTGAMTRDQFWQFIIAKFSIQESSDYLEKEWINCYDVNEEVKNIILSLKKTCGVYYLSNAVKVRFEQLDAKFQLRKLFNDGICSHEVKLRKPDPEIYKFILQKFGLKPEETIFIDDKEKNLPPARELGMKTVLFVSAENLKLRFDQFLV